MYETAIEEKIEAAKTFHCGNACPLEKTGVECPQEHWCGGCGDCLYCYGPPPHFDGD